MAVGFLTLCSAQAQTFNVNFSSFSGANCVKNKIGVYQTPFMGTAGIAPPTAMQPLLAEANVKDLRYEVGWGKGDTFAYNQIGGTSANPTINFAALDPFITMLKSNGVSLLLAMTYCPTPLQTSDWKNTPNNLTSWQSIIQQYVAHYSGALGYSGIRYEMWNEPDYIAPVSSSQYGSIYQYGSAGVRAGAADARVGGPAIAYDTSFVTASGMLNQPVDFASIHAYANYASQIGNLQNVLNASGKGNLPILLTEYASYDTGCATCDNNTYPAAAKLFQDVKGLLTYSNVPKVYWAQWIDTDGGMIFYNLRKKAIFNAYKIYQAMLPVKRNTVSPDGSGGVNIMAASSGVKGGVVVWNNNAGSSSVTVNLNTLPFSGGTLNLYRIDSTHADYVSNPGSENLATNETVNFAGNATSWTGSIPGKSLIYLEALSSGGGGGPTATATFITTDAATQGNWKTAYGADGYSVFGDTNTYPAYATVAVGGSAFTWTASTTAARALQRAGNPTNRIAATVFGGSFSIDCNLSGTNAHQVALYGLDWDSTNRNETVQVVDAGSDTVLDTQTLADFNGGKYLVWNIKGNVRFDVGINNGPNAVISGIFFGGPASLGNLSATLNGNTLTITWPGAGNLQSAPALTDPWQTVAGATSGYQTTVSGAKIFFRLKQ